MMPDDYGLSELECDAMVKDLITISEMALAVKISFVWSPGMPSGARANLRNAILGLYCADCAHYFDANSASFTFEDAAIDAEAYEAIQLRIESMIHKLAPKPKKKKQTEEMEEKMDEALTIPKPPVNDGPFERFEDFLYVVQQSELGQLIPPPLCQIVVQYRGQNNLYWSMMGDDVEVTDHKLTIIQQVLSKSFLFFFTVFGNYSTCPWTRCL